MVTLVKNQFVLFVESIGRSIITAINGLGAYTKFNLSAFYWLFRSPFRLKLIFEQLHFVGNKSLFIVILTGSFTGMVMSYQTYFGFQVISGDTLVGPITALSIFKELAAVLTGLIVAGRAGAAMAAQIGTMRVTEQIDALEVMGINSIQYLVVPRVIAGFFSVPLLAIIFMLIGNFGSWLIGVKVLQIDASLYFSKLPTFVFVEDIFQGIIKAFAFGFMVTMIGCYFGYKVKGGAEGVGKGTNKAVVWGMVTVLVMDFFLTSFLIRIL